MIRRSVALAVSLSLVAALAPVAGAQDGSAAVPSTGQIAAANAWVKSRRGRIAFAVVDSAGVLRGRGLHSRFISASVVKAMLLVEYLRDLDREGRPLSRADENILTPMIRVSDNNAATEIARRVGDAGLRRLARVTGMKDFVIGPNWLTSCRCRGGGWARAQLSAGDQARFFYDMDRYVPAQFRDFERNLFETVSEVSAWGIPAAARPLGWRVFWKVGVRATGLGKLIHQAARLELGETRVGVAVLTDGNPSYDYGKATVEGAGEQLFGTLP